MALNVKDPETDRLARELAALTGESITLALRRALEQRLKVERHKAMSGPRDLSEIISLGAWRRFSKGCHPAGLNYGDCFAYALAHRRAIPLLFIGDDFTKTDIEEAFF